METADKGPQCQYRSGLEKKDPSHRITPLFDWISDVNPGTDGLKINVDAKQKEDLVKKTAFVVLEKLPMMQPEFVDGICHSTVEAMPTPRRASVVNEQGLKNTGRRYELIVPKSETSELEEARSRERKFSDIFSEFTKCDESASQRLGADGSGLDNDSRHQNASSDGKKRDTANNISKNDCSRSLRLKRADGEWRVSQMAACQDLPNGESGLDLEISNVVSLNNEYCMRFESLNEDYNVAVLDYSFQTQTPEASSWQHIEKTLPDSPSLVDDQNRILRRRVARAEYEFETLSEPGHGLYLVEEPELEEPKHSDPKIGIRKEFFTRSKIRRAGRYRRKKVLSPWKLARAVENSDKQPDTDSDGIEADDLPEIHPPKRRRQFRSRPLHPVLVTATANSELKRLSQEFPKHNWLEQKIRLTQNDMSLNVESKSDELSEKEDVTENDLDAATDIENNNEIVEDHNNETETVIDTKSEPADRADRPLRLETSDLVIDEQSGEESTDLDGEQRNTDNDDEITADEVSDSRLVIAETDDILMRTEEMDELAQVEASITIEEGDMKRSEGSEEKLNQHQGFWAANPPVARKKTPVQRVQPQMKPSDSSPVSAPQCSERSGCSADTTAEAPRASSPEAESTAGPVSNPNGPQLMTDDQITIRRFMEEIQETIERNVESVPGPSSGENKTTIPVMKPLVHPPIPSLAIHTGCQDGGLSTIPKLISVYDGAPAPAISPAPASAAAAHERGVFINNANALMAMSAIDVPASGDGEEGDEQARKRPADTPNDFDPPKVARTEDASPPSGEEPRHLDEAQQKELTRLKTEFQHVDALIAIKEREKQSLMVTRNKLGVLIAKIGLRMNVSEEGPIATGRSLRPSEEGSPPLRRPESAQGCNNSIIAHRTRSTVPRHLLYPDKFSKKDILHSSEMKSRCQEGLAKRIAEQVRCNEAASSRTRGQPSPWKRYSQAQMSRNESNENVLNLSAQPAPPQPLKADVVDLTNEKSTPECPSQDLQLTATGLVPKKEAQSAEDSTGEKLALNPNAHVIPALQPPVHQPKSSPQLQKDPHMCAILGALGFTDMRAGEAQRPNPQPSATSGKSLQPFQSSPSAPAVAVPNRHGPPGLQPAEPVPAPVHVSHSPRSTTDTRQMPQQRGPTQPVFPGPPPRLEPRRSPPNDQLSHDAFVRMAAQQAMQRSSRPSHHVQTGHPGQAMPQRPHGSHGSLGSHGPHGSGVIRHTTPQTHPGYMYQQQNRHSYPQSGNNHHQNRRDAPGLHKPNQHSPPGLHSPQQPIVRPNMVQYPGMVPAQYQHQLIMEQQMREQQMRAAAPQSNRSQHSMRQQQAPQFMMSGHMDPRHAVPQVQSEIPVYMERILGQLPPGHENLPMHQMPMNHADAAQMHHSQVRQMEAARHQSQVVNHGQYPPQPRAPPTHEPSQATRTNGHGGGMQVQPERYCFACHNVASYLCSGCKKVWFCTAECQMKGWVAHSKDCIRSSKEEG